MTSPPTESASRRPTRQRAALAELMAETSEFLSAQDLHSKLQSRGDSVGLATVYRNLQAMAADGDVDVLRTDDGECVYRSCATDAHHHHLVCRECGRTVEVEGPAVEKWAAEVARANGFSDVTHTIELFGTCTSH
ncbi:Fur family transcriptional regulator [Knoellia subterranea]|uniref:Fur family transcriptional regulator n=1 Tax=Knoellia subterranea KCTC 19937 TaxID=1385521 RepID=A0A0A0JSM0_9MICO|nr:transcriptional repressor [Knoellia subterranea]KGN39042.1 Fur family transcriptional regulator [Knoellia subterranea KCTC 19937]